MCELFNVAFGFALVFMKATLDTDTPVALFACVGRCFTVDALLTHGITTVEKEPLSALGAVPQSPLAGRALCHPRVAPLASPRPQGDVPTFQAGGSLTSPLQPAPALAFRGAAAGPPMPPPAPHGCGGCEGPSPREGSGAPGWEGLGRTFPAAPAPAKVTHRPLLARPSRGAPRALPPWRGRPAAGAGRARRHSRCQRRYILPEPLPPPSSRLAGWARPSPSAAPGDGREGPSPGPAASAPQPG